MLRDNHLNCDQLFPVPDTLGCNAAQATIDLSKAFGVWQSLMYDCYTYLKTETINTLSKRLRVPHPFKYPY